MRRLAALTFLLLAGTAFAVNEKVEEIEYYATISPRLAELYDKAVRAAEMQAAATPEAWPEYRRRIRRVVDRRFKFSLVYLYSENEICVVAIAPMKRRPGYWQRRVRGE